MSFYNVIVQSFKIRKNVASKAKNKIFLEKKTLLNKKYLEISIALNTKYLSCLLTYVISEKLSCGKQELYASFIIGHICR